MKKPSFDSVRICVIGFVVSGIFGTLILGQPSGTSGNPIFVAPVLAQCPDIPAVNVSSSDVPKDVCIPDGFQGNPIAFFDDYSWRSFVALVWPAQPGQRGLPDTSKLVGDPGPLVFETYKADWEVFQPQGAKPAAWDKFDGINPCSLTTLGHDDLVLASFSKFGNLAQAGFGKLAGPLVAQNNTYVRFLTGFNKTEFIQILDQQLYFQGNLGKLTLADGALDVKSAWVDMAGLQHPERYYTRSAWVFDLEQSKCVQKVVGLVGLHIVQKTPSRPQWIWSSFEQIDNIPQAGALPQNTFHDNTTTAMPSPPNPIPFPPPPIPPMKFNVQRVMPITSSTQATNLAYQQALRNQNNTVWQFYQLVMTQWPLQLNPPQPIPPTQSGRPDATFPGTGATTSFANVTLETFDQSNIITGCMNCHNGARVSADFLWTLKVNAFPSSVLPPSLPPIQPTPNLGLMAAKAKKLSPELQELKKLMQTVVPASAKASAKSKHQKEQK